MKRAKVIRKITMPIQDHLNRLAEILYPFLPLNANSPKTITFKTIFAESHVSHYFNANLHKGPALQKALTEVYKRHERLMHNLIRKIVPAAILYRYAKRNPLKRAELDALGECLLSLNIDLIKEFSDIQLDETLPRITVPPKNLKERLRNHDLHPALSSDPLDLFDNGHFNEAVRKGAERFEVIVKELSGLDDIGRGLMGNAFRDDTYLDMALYKPNNQSDFIDGYRFLSMGSMSAIRNVFSHGDEQQRTPEECFEMLMLLNWLFRAILVSDEINE